MKYTIEGFSQEKAIEYGLDIEDLVILRWFVDFCSRIPSKEIDGENFFWINYQAILTDMPILGFKTKDRLYRKLKNMVDKGVLTHQNLKNSEGNFSYYGFGEKYQELVGKNTVPYGKNNGTLTVKITEQNNYSTKETNNICPSNDERLSEDFELIWKEYPRKDSKNTAFRHYKSWLVGKKYAGKTIKLTNKQMWFAVRTYKNECESKMTEKQYIKMGSTFFNESIYEYVQKNELEGVYNEKNF